MKKLILILICLALNLYSFLFLIEYFIPLKVINSKFKCIETTANNPRKNVEICNFAKFEKYKMPIQLSDIVSLEKETPVTIYVRFFTNIPTKFSFIENNKIIFLHPNAGLLIHYVFLPFLCIILGLFSLVNLNNNLIYKIIPVNMFFVFMEWLVCDYFN